FGCVHFGKTMVGNIDVALKFELKQDGVVRTLFHEKEIYNRLRGIPGVAQAIAVEELQNVDLLVLPYIGPSLADLAKARPLSLDELCHIGAKTLRTLYHIHSAGVLHGDIKHNNILCCQKTGEIFMTDYGCSGLTTDQAPMGGTFAYLSRNAHNHMNATTDDDVESWYYTMFRLTKSYLPWDDLVDKNMDCPEVINALLKRKIDFWDNHEFAQVLPSPLNEIFMEFNHWQKNDNPTKFNYERIITILEGSSTKGPLDLSAVAIDTNFTVDQVFRTLVSTLS
ncbi:kinase-like domain-containing protein, partial [Paraphysoderma sedebokerense]